MDVTTVEEIVGSMEARFGLAKRVWVMDRGTVREENVSLLQRTGRRYVASPGFSRRRTDMTPDGR